MLGPRQPDALRPVAPGQRGVFCRVGVGPDSEIAELVGPFEKLIELGWDLRRDELDLALIDDSGRPVDGDHLTTSDIDTPGGGDARLGIDLELGRPGDGGFAHAHEPPRQHVMSCPPGW